MLLQKTLRALIVAVLAFSFLEGLSWFTASVPPCLVQDEYQPQATNHDNQKDCPTFYAGSKILLARLYLFIESHDKSIVATFTVVLAISTIGLWFATIGLYRAGERQIAAIKESADAARDAAEHIPRVERAYVCGGVNFLHVQFNPPDPERMIVTLNNYGKTPAFVGTIAVGVCEEERLNERPPWSRIEFKGYYLPYNPDVDNPLKSDVIFPTPALGHVVFGRIWYRDIFNQFHSAGFALRAQGGLPAVSGHDEYWEERDEPDLGPATHPPLVDRS